MCTALFVLNIIFVNVVLFSRSSGLAKTILQGTVSGREEGRQAEKKMGGQHHSVDRLEAERRPEKIGESRGMEGTGCQVICGAPTVSQTTG